MAFSTLIGHNGKTKNQLTKFSISMSESNHVCMFAETAPGGRLPNRFRWGPGGLGLDEGRGALESPSIAF